MGRHEQNVLITGGASGLGEACVRDFAKRGARVVAADLNIEKGLQLEAELVSAGLTVKFIQVDVLSAASHATMLRQALAWLPTAQAFDHAVFCAGSVGTALDMDPADPADLDDHAGISRLLNDFASCTSVNLVGLLNSVQLLVKYGMGLSHAPTDSKRNKSITLLGSITSYRVIQTGLAYSASKWGVRGAFRGLRLLLPACGVRVNLVAPSFVETSLLSAKDFSAFRSRGARFTSAASVVQAVSTITQDESYQGRALGVFDEGIVELHDDTAGRDGFDVVQGLSERQAFHIGERGTLFEG